MLINNFINTTQFNIIIIISFIFTLGIIFSNFYLKSFFSLCYSNEKTSIKHPPMIRGLGVWYIISLIPLYFLDTFIFQIHEWSLIFLSVLLGFFDDKYGITQKNKLIILFALWTFYKVFSLNFDLHEKLIFDYNLIIEILLFIFFILFFNQIDGINGLAGLTYITFVLSITYIAQLANFNLICLSMAFIYLVINLYGKIGIQGESGSFFMGCTSYLFVMNNLTGFEKIYSVFFVSPILIDLVTTSLLLIYIGHNLFKGHRENVYQKLSFELQSHSIVSFGFAFIQLLISIYIIYIWHKGINSIDVLILIFYVMLVCFILYTIRKILETKKNES